MTEVCVTNVSFGYGSARTLSQIHFDLARGAFLGIVGTNGSGKTTLLKLLQRLIVPQHGRLIIRGTDLSRYSGQQLARTVATSRFLEPPPFDMSVREFVALGRTPYLNAWGWERPEDRRAVIEAMRLTACEPFSERSVARLSSGELQRVCLAATLAQQPAVLLLDEPTCFLDLKQRSRLSSVLSALQRRELTILCASHDLPFLSRHCDSILLLQEGKQLAFGPAHEILRGPQMADLFEMDAEGCL